MSRKEVYYSNMNVVRYVLALMVVLAHFSLIVGPWIPLGLTSGEILGGFFVLSGFFAYSGYERHSSLGKYIKHRVRRILPPYLAVVIFFWLILSFWSNLGVKDYFLNPVTWKYLIFNVCFLNWLQPTLPGLFEGVALPESAVNGALWTMKVEWCLFLSVPIAAYLIKKLKIRRDWMAWIVIFMSIGYRFLFGYMYESEGKEIYNILGRQVFGQLSYYYIGILIYFYREKFERHLGQIIIISVGLMLLSPLSGWTEIVLAPFGMSGVVMGISLINRSLSIFRHNNNISYLIYLCHWPILQIGVMMGLKSVATWLALLIVIASCVLFSIAGEYCLARFFPVTSSKE